MKSYFNSISVWLFVGFLAFLVWASMFHIDQSVSAQGQIIPSARTQIVQTFDGGVLAELRVNEGQHVIEGETLAVLERERAIAAYEESQVRLKAQQAGLIRAKAEIAGEEPLFDSSFDDFSEFVQLQLGSYQQRKKSLEDASLILAERIEIAEEVMNINEDLHSTGDISRMDVLQSRRELAQLRGEQSSLINEYFQTAQEEATRLQAELESTTNRNERLLI